MRMQGLNGTMSGFYMPLSKRKGLQLKMDKLPEVSIAQQEALHQLIVLTALLKKPNTDFHSKDSIKIKHRYVRDLHSADMADLLITSSAGGLYLANNVVALCVIQKALEEESSWLPGDCDDLAPP